MDRLDKEIVRLLQQDATLSVSEIAERIGLSTTPCWKRIQRLEQQGVIIKRVALADAESLGLHMTAFVLVKTTSHESNWLNAFAEHASSLDEVTEFYRMSGEYDYMLKVLVKDMKAYDLFYKKLVSNVDIANVTTNFAMEQIKYTTELPVN
ncbi:Lrp/AsnC family transcriptional regulator [Thalassotalea sp. M1531]|uniref:Lrp/AsnC family transcriptional regulator n=1 Tax=Thalassotalea algicola TaxID=2716224 RepID=A0A7Y0LBY2_9GAMM|nr:Lrp/AsnC family transcriptional regulator [Thalassotalea algicola]NMP31723.1 Lrp/AsnC family transcriptional regulator [Thalassotalea algicola]